MSRKVSFFGGSIVEFIDLYAISYNGTTQDLNGGDVLDQGPNSFTVLTWIKVDPTLSGFGRVVQKRGLGASGTAAGFQLVVGTSGSGDVGVSNTIYDDGVGNFALITGSPVIGTVDTWILVAFVIDRSLNQLRLYADGVLKATNSIPGATGSIDNARDFIFGSSGSSQYFKGLINDSAIVTGVLTGPQLVEAYNGGVTYNWLISSFAGDIQSYWLMGDVPGDIISNIQDPVSGNDLAGVNMTAANIVSI